MMMRRVSKGQRVTGEHFLEVSKRLEKKTVDRLYQLKKHNSFKTKNKALQRKDKAFSIVIKQHKRGEITLEAYVDKIIKLNREKDLPKGRKALFRFLESDSESED